jgi:hypothetical protein
LICCKAPACQAFSSSPSVPIPRTSQACRSLRQDLSVLRNIAYGRHDTLNVYHLSSSMCSLSNRGLDFQLVQQRTNESKSHYQVANTSEISMYVLHMPMVDGELHSIDRSAVDAWTEPPHLVVRAGLDVVVYLRCAWAILYLIGWRGRPGWAHWRWSRSRRRGRRTGVVPMMFFMMFLGKKRYLS